MNQSPVSRIAVIYCRVSTDRQEEDGTSLDSQEQECRNYCAVQGLAVVDVVREVASGADTDRPGLQRALDILYGGDASTLVVYAYDRLSRSLNHQASLVFSIEERHGGVLLSVSEPRDTSLVGSVMRTLKGYLAEEERNKLIERTNRGRRMRANKGALLGGVALYGYVWTDDGHTAYAPDPETAPVVRRIFDEARAGRSLAAIARGLTADGIPTPSQRHARREGQEGKTGRQRQVSAAWWMESVRGIIRHPAYKGAPVAFRLHTAKERKRDAETGFMRTRQRWTPGDAPIPLPTDAAPALVSPELWQATNDQIKRNKAEASRSNDHAEEHLLRAGFAYCAYCGRKMYVIHRRQGERVYYSYKCASRFGASRAYCPGNGHSVSCATLDADIWQKVVLVLNTDTAAQALNNRTGSDGGRDSATLERLRERQGGIEGTMEQLQKHRRNLRRQQESAFDNDEFNELEARIREDSERLRQLTTERDELQEAIEERAGLGEMVHPLIERLRHGSIEQIGYTDSEPPFEVEPGEVTFLPGNLIAFELDELPPDMPEPGEPGWQEAMLTAIYAFTASHKEQLRGQIVIHLTDDLTMTEKRAILRWLGVRVNVYRRSEPRPDGNSWELLFQTPQGDGPFPLAETPSNNMMVSQLRLPIDAKR